MKTSPLLIRPYHIEDFDILVSLLEQLQDYVSALDTLNMMRRLPEYGKDYTQRLLERVEKDQGKILLAELNKKPVGMIAGAIREQTPAEQLEKVYAKRGRILELFVEEKARKLGVGKRLMESMEEYLASQGCTVIRIEVFAANQNARDFYDSLGYNDRVVDMMKKIV